MAQAYKCINILFIILQYGKIEKVVFKYTLK